MASRMFLACCLKATSSASLSRPAIPFNRKAEALMKIWYNNIIDTERHVVEVQGDRIRIGRAASNEIVLDSPYVADEAAVLYRRGGTPGSSWRWA